MKKFIVLLGISLSFSLFADAILAGKVTRISDGDTIVVTASSTQYKVRLVGIDTPELHLVTPKGTFGQQPWGQAATDYLNDVLPVGTEIKLQVHGTDKYHRTLGRIYKNNQDINLQLVQSGWAVPYLICEGVSCDRRYFENFGAANYLKACKEARRNETGIFDRHQPLKEMPFEFRLRLQNRKPEKWAGSLSHRQYVSPDQYKKVDLCDRVFFIRENEAKAAGFFKAH